MSSDCYLIHRSCIVEILFSEYCSLSLHKSVSLYFLMIRWLLVFSLQDVTAFQSVVVQLAFAFQPAVVHLALAAPSAEPLLSFGSPQMAQAFSLLLSSAILSSSVPLLIHPAPDLSEVMPL